MEYSASVWSPHTQKDTNCLERVQRRAARFVTGDYNRTSSVTSMMADLNWETLAERRAKAQVTLLYKITYELVDIPCRVYLTPQQTTSRGHDLRFFLPYCRTVTYKQSFFPTASRLWNQLPAQLVNIPDPEVFKRDLSAHTLL